MEDGLLALFFKTALHQLRENKARICGSYAFSREEIIISVLHALPLEQISDVC